MLNHYPGWTPADVAELTPGQLLIFWHHAVQRDAGDDEPGDEPGGSIQTMDPHAAAELIRKKRARQGGA